MDFYSVIETYEFILNTANSGIEDLARNALVRDASDQFTVELLAFQRAILPFS